MRQHRPEVRLPAGGRYQLDIVVIGRGRGQYVWLGRGNEPVAIIYGYQLRSLRQLLTRRNEDQGK